MTNIRSLVNVRSLAVTLAAGMMLLAGAQDAKAQEIVFTGKKCPLTVITDLEAYEASQGKGTAGQEAEAETDENGETIEAEEGKDGETTEAEENREGENGETAEAEETTAEEAGESGDETTAEEAGEAGEETTAEEAGEAGESGDETTAAAGEVTEPAKAAETVRVTKLNLLGIVDDTYVAVRYKKDQNAYIPLKELQENVIAYDVNELDHVTGWTNLENGSKGDEAKEAQQALIDLEYLNGKADGAYGNKTAEAVTKFQEAEGLEATGTVDIFTWFLLKEQTAGKSEAIETPYPPVFTVESKYASIYADLTDASVLENYLEPKWKYNYDVFEGEGTITSGVTYGKWKDKSDRAIDRLSMTADQIVYLMRNDVNKIDIYPAIRVTSNGATRPNIRSILLRVNNSVVELPTLVSKGSLDGTDVEETTIVPLTEEAQAMLDAAASGDDITLRLHGTSHDYDINVK